MFRFRLRRFLALLRFLAILQCLAPYRRLALYLRLAPCLRLALYLFVVWHCVVVWRCFGHRYESSDHWSEAKIKPAWVTDFKSAAMPYHLDDINDIEAAQRVFGGLQQLRLPIRFALPVNFFHYVQRLWTTSSLEH